MGLIAVCWLGALLWGLGPLSPQGHPEAPRADDVAPQAQQGEDVAHSDGNPESGGSAVQLAESPAPQPPAGVHPEPERPLPAKGQLRLATGQPRLATGRPKFLAPRNQQQVSCGGHYAATCAECVTGHDAGWCHGDCRWNGEAKECRDMQAGTPLHPAIKTLIREYPYQPVRCDQGQLVNIILVRSPFRSMTHRAQHEQYKNEILFLGISSFEDYPLPPLNPFSSKFPADYYVGMFPGFLHMFREGLTKVFPSQVKLLLMSQSDFALPDPGAELPKKYDFVFSGTDQDVWNDCVGWSSFAKNWTFVLQALEVMCGEYGMTGVLVATKDKQGRKACTIPKSCHGKIVQTSFLSQGDFFTYVKESRFAFVPQVHDASPRAASQALALNTPVLMNWHLLGGWKYLNDQTGEFFHDMTDFRASLDRIMRKAKNGGYEPRKYMLANYGDEIAGARLKRFIEDNFGDRVKLPEDCRLLIPSGA